MTDLHTHILPGIDDGAKDVNMSLRMIEKSVMEGAGRIALTPHFYPEHFEVSDFLQKRNNAYDTLSKAIEAGGLGCPAPEFILGAEVAFSPKLLDMDLRDLEKLCYGDSDYFLLELPYDPVTDDIIRLINNFIVKTGFTPVIAHIDRYFGLYGIDHVIDLDIPIQISAEALMSNDNTSKLALKMIKRGDAQILISDCHNMDDRKPNLKAGYAVIEKKLGRRFAEDMQDFSDRIAEVDAGEI